MMPMQVHTSKFQVKLVLLLAADGEFLFLLSSPPLSAMETEKSACRYEAKSPDPVCLATGPITTWLGDIFVRRWA